MKDAILSFYLYVRPFINIGEVKIPIEIGPNPTLPHATLPYQQHLPLSLPYTASIPIEIGPKWLRAETTQDRNGSPT